MVKIQMRKRTTFILTAAGVGFAVLIALVITAGVLNYQQGQSRKENTGFSWPVNSDGYFAVNDNNEPVVPSVGDSFIFIQAQISFVDVNNNLFQVYCTFTPTGKFVNKDSPQSLVNVFDGGDRVRKYPLQVPISITFDDKTVQFGSNQIMPSTTVTHRIAYGDPNAYPFDQYTTDTYYITARYRNPETNQTEPVPLLYAIVGALQSWQIQKPVVEDMSDGRGLVIASHLTILRSMTTRAFSIFIISMLWVLSAFVFVLSVTLWYRGRKVEPPTMAVATGLLFAMPAVRNTQPGAPPIGCTADTVGFFFNMVLGAVSVALLLLNYIIKYKPKKPVKKATTMKLQRVNTKAVP
ncbi:hypothetical protein HK102_003339 [Quaeritorhiza haematococci]|nr:hypothetical protein HK102_003339 [Quaeritorhiza haematococci]